MIYTPTRTLPRRPAPTLTVIATLVMVTLFAGALVVFGLRPDGPGDSSPSGGLPAQTQESPPSPTVYTGSPAPPLDVTPTPVTGPGAGGTPWPTAPAIMSPTPYALPPQQMPATLQLEGITWQAQTWNNAGPAALSMALDFFGRDDTQAEIGAWVRGNEEDKWTQPWELVAYVNHQTNLDAIYRVGGTVVVLKRLLATGLPVIVPVGQQVDGEWQGHYLLVAGYDENIGAFRVYDSYRGDGVTAIVPYGSFDTSWRQFNRTFIVPYLPAQSDMLKDTLGPYLDPMQAINLALQTARRATQDDETDAWAWLNLGSSHAALGAYDPAVGAFDQAINQEPPWRWLWYHPEVFEAYTMLGEYERALALTGQVLDQTEWIEGATYWQAMIQAAVGEPGWAAESFADLLAHNPNYLLMLRWRFQSEGLGPLPFGSPFGQSPVAPAPPPLTTQLTPTTLPFEELTPTILSSETPTAPVNTFATPGAGIPPAPLCQVFVVEETELIDDPSNGEGVIQVSEGQTLTVIDQTVTSDGARWFRVQFAIDDTTIEGAWIMTRFVVEESPCPPPPEG